VNEKIIELIPEHQTHLTALCSACRDSLLSMKATLDIKLQQELPDLDKAPSRVGKLFKRLVLYHNKLLPYELLSLMEEARKDTCVPVLQARNYVLVSTHKRFIAALEKLAVYVQLALSTDSHTRAQEANAPTILKNACNSLASVHQAFQAYASHLISKISQEHRAPFVLPELKAVNEKVLNSLSVLTASTGKMVELMNDYMNSHSSQGAPCTVRGVECDPLKMSEDLGRMQSRARLFFGQMVGSHGPRPRKAISTVAQPGRSQSDPQVFGQSNSESPSRTSPVSLAPTSPEQATTDGSSFAEDPLLLNAAVGAR